MSGNLARDGEWGGSRGLGLAEALVAITILALAGTVAFVLYNGARDSFKVGDNLTEQQQVVRIAFDELSEDLRLAGFNSDPDGDKTRPDEAIEVALETAIVFRADFDAEDPTDSVDPEATLADTGSGSAFFTVSTGNDEIVAYALANDDSAATLTFEADVKQAVRDGIVDLVELEDLALTQDDPPYTLYRITLDDSGDADRTPVVDNVRSLRFVYHDSAGNELAPVDGMDDGDGVNRAARAKIRRIGIEIEGLTRDPHLGWQDPDDPVMGPGGVGQYRKFALSGDVTPRNLGKFGVKDLEANYSPPAQPPPPSLYPGHCEGLWVVWAPNPPQDEVARYEVRYGQDPDNLQGPDYAGESEHYISGLSEGEDYFVTVEAVDDSGDISLPSPVASVTTENLNTPEQPTDPTATKEPEPLENRIELTWSLVTENVADPTAEPVEDPLSPQMRDFLHYRVYRDTDPGFDPADADPLAEGATVTLRDGGTGDPDDDYLEFVDTAVVNCRPYTYKVTATDLCGEEGDEAVATGNARTFTAPQTPTNVQAYCVGACSGGKIRVEWDPVMQDAAGLPIHIEDYQVLHAQGNVGDNPEALNYTLRDLTLGRTWFEESLITVLGLYVDYYRVVAQDDCGNESAPSGYTSAECEFRGDVEILTPLGNYQISDGESPVPIRVDVVDPGATYAAVHLSVTEVSTGIAVLTRVLTTDPPWHEDWDVGSLDVGSYRIHATVEQSDGCAKSATIPVSK